MARVGLLTCANVARDMACTMTGCIEALNDRQEHFKIHDGEETLRLMGVVTCDGCPTAVAHDRILNRIRGLVKLGADVIHVSSCVTAVCPFLRKYEKAIREAFPAVKLVLGTHGGMPGQSEEETMDMFRGMVGGMLGGERKTLPDAMVEAMAAARPPDGDG